MGIRSQQTALLVCRDFARNPRMNPFPDPQGADFDASLITPAWGDDFDLRPFFRNLHPRLFPLRDSAEYAPAETLFKLVQWLVLRWIALYRCNLRLASRHPELIAKTALCVQMMKTGDAQAYHSWFLKNNKDFEGQAPRDWFLRNELEELARLLQLEPEIHSATQTLGPASLRNVPEGGDSTRSFPNLPGEASDLNEFRTRFLNWLSNRSNRNLESESALKSLLDRWRPDKQSLASTSDRLLAFELFSVLEVEFCGWLSLYRGTLKAGLVHPGVIAKVLHCLGALQTFPPNEYLDWFRSPQADFNGKPPEVFFAEKGLFELIFLLSGTTLPVSCS